MYPGRYPLVCVPGRIESLPSCPRSLGKASSPRDRRKQVADLGKLLQKTKQRKKNKTKFSRLNEKMKAYELLFHGHRLKDDLSAPTSLYSLGFSLLVCKMGTFGAHTEGGSAV